MPGAIVVSGATRGVGRAAAEMLADAGFTVFAGMLTAADAQAWADSRVARGAIIPVALDITQPDDIAQLLATLAKHGQTLQALVNVAGLAQFDAIEHVEQRVIRRLFDVNVFGTLALTQALLPSLKASRGRVVFVTSMAGRASAPLMGAYASTKSAMESLIDALRMEMRPFGVTVTIVEPGAIRTGMTDEALVHLEQAALCCDGTPYAPAYRTIAGMIMRDVKTYLAPDAVARVLARLVLAPSVPARTRVGRDAKLLVALRWLLPDAWMDALLARQMKLAKG